jgi:hypothetical protein
MCTKNFWLLSFFSLFFLIINCGDNNPINLATSSDLLIPKNSITLEAKNKPEWAHLRFIVFKLDDNWDVYHSESDNIFSFRLRNLVKKYVMNL